MSPPAPMAPDIRRSEDGRVMLLILGFSTVVMALALIVASVASLHLERKHLLATADAAALAAAASLDSDRYYRSGGERVVLTDATVSAAVHRYLASHGGEFRELRVVEARTPDGRTAVVRLTAIAEIPFIPWLTQAVPEWVRIDVSAQARAG